MLPAARSVLVGQQASAFATIINAGTTPALGCTLAKPAGFPGEFAYQVTDAANTPIGTPNSPIDIAAGAAQGFVFTVQPGVVIDADEFALLIDCANTPVTPTIVGLNNLLLSASVTARPDMIAIVSTPSNDGIVTVPEAAGTAYYAAAVINIGANGPITASIDDAGAGVRAYVTLCQSNPATAACDSPDTPVPSVRFDSPNGGIATFTIKVTATGEVPFDPANNRLFLRFSRPTASRAARPRSR